MKKLLPFLIFLGAITLVAGNAYAISVYQTLQGGTGTSSPSGILYGDNNATTHLNTVTIGTGLLFSGGTLSSTGGGFGEVFQFFNNKSYIAPTTTVGVILNASSTILNLTSILSTTTNATTTNFAITGSAANCNGTNALTTLLGGGVTCTAQPQGTVTAVSVATANGFAGTSGGGATPALTLTTTITGLLKGNGTAISAATPGTDYAIFSFPWTPASTYATTTRATTTPEWFQTALYASSTVGNPSVIDNLVTGNSTTTNATTTNLNVSGQLKNGSGSALALQTSGVFGAYGGSNPCTNQVALSISATGVISCTSISDAMISSTFVKTLSVTTAQGVSGSFTAGATPALSLTLGALTGVTSFNGLVVTANTGAITTGSWAATSIPVGFTDAKVVSVTGTGGTTCSGTNPATCNSFSYPWNVLSNFATTTSATSSSIWLQGGSIFSSSSVASQLPYASTTAVTSVTASTTNLIVSGLAGASGCLTPTVTGSITTTACSGGSSSSFGESWKIVAATYLTPTSTIQSIIAAASSTIGNGTQFGGLTINGGATTTANMSVLGNMVIGTSSNLLGTTTTGGLSLWNTNTAGTYPYITMGGNSGGDTDYWIGRTTNNDTIGGMDYLQIGAGLSPGVSPFMTWDGNRGVEGIGTTTPNFLLTVSSSTAAQLLLTDGFNNTSEFFSRAFNGSYWFGTTTGSATTTNPIFTFTASTTFSGLMGIGTSSPKSALDVNGQIKSGEFYMATSTAVQTTNVTVDWSASSTQNQILLQISASTVNVQFVNFYAGETKRVMVCNSLSAAGTLAFTYNYNGNSVAPLWPNGTAPAQTTTAKRCDLWSFVASFGTSTNQTEIFGSQTPF